MLLNFICPDKYEISTQSCLASCRMEHRCLTLPTLKMIATTREWSGEPSTTQCLNGTMEEYLKLTKPFSVVPESKAFMLAGTKHHKALEDVARELGLPAEIALNVDKDIFDLLEFEEDKLVMTDYKLWGSYKVAKVLGIVKVGTQPDPTGAVYKTNSRWGKAGEPKMVPVFARKPELEDNLETELQQNRYKLLLKKIGVDIHRMQLQVTVRDGGIALAYSRGVYQNIYLIPVKELEPDIVEGYFEMKKTALIGAMIHGWSTPCDSRECWEGRKCQAYCDVWHYCPRGVQEHYEMKPLEGE